MIRNIASPSAAPAARRAPGPADETRLNQRFVESVASLIQRNLCVLLFLMCALNLASLLLGRLWAAAEPWLFGRRAGGRPRTRSRSFSEDDVAAKSTSPAQRDLQRVSLGKREPASAPVGHPPNPRCPRAFLSRTSCTVHAAHERGRAPGLTPCNPAEAPPSFSRFPVRVQLSGRYLSCHPFSTL